ncbi:transglycosylase domain-containing protein [Saccharothrix longispora]|uniref:transglycosylase domain-containing protein n=1 Tax=Saccharothrix longispora TaxID=33920 RepID=UPI0028FD71CE|nr:transglycosylase domain-containing protein [Saccharothrix longispora]MDU0291728.1 transglycosylase domain-containing protein [Saccharothrix longispora]
MRTADSIAKLAGLCLVAGLLVAGMALPVVGGAGLASNRVSDQVAATSVRLLDQPPPLMTTVTDKDGVPFAYLYDQYRVLTPSDRVAQVMKDALISAEDRRFYEHAGVDWLATVRAAMRNQSEGQVTQGASSITQQYVKNYLVHVLEREDKGGQAEAQEQTITRKLREARIAMHVEAELTKDEILTRYLDVVPFGGTIYGIAAASQAYFETTPDKLTVPQAALLAGLVNSPTFLDPEARPDKAVERRNTIIDLMADNAKLSREQAEVAKRAPLGLADPVRPLPTGCVGSGPEVGFFCSYVVNYLTTNGFDLEQLKVGGYTVRTTLDRSLTQQAKQAAEAQVPKTTPGIANTAAIVRPGRDRHEVVALVANRDYGLKKEEFQTQFDLPSAVENKFGAGSVYKVFTAAAALDKGMGIETVIETPNSHVSRVFRGGAPSCPSTGEQATYWYCLSNHDDSYPPRMTLKQALATSPNTGFVILEEKVGLAAVIDMARRLGMRETLSTNIAGVLPNPEAERQDLRVSQAEFYESAGNASFTLGPAPTNTLELANVAATIASGGRWCRPTPILRVTDRYGRDVPVTEPPCEQAVPEGLANALAVGLSEDDQERGTAAAAAKHYNWTRPALGKTGTTEEYKSAAFIGATPDFAGAVQVFNDGVTPRGICVEGGPPRLCAEGDIYGGTLPARTWFDFMTKAHEGLPEKPLPQVEPRYLRP